MLFAQGNTTITEVGPILNLRDLISGDVYGNDLYLIGQRANQEKSSLIKCHINKSMKTISDCTSISENNIINVSKIKVLRDQLLVGRDNKVFTCSLNMGNCQEVNTGSKNEVMDFDVDKTNKILYTSQFGQMTKCEYTGLPYLKSWKCEKINNDNPSKDFNYPKIAIKQ